VAGCSAEGTPNGEALGTTSQASGTFTPSGFPTDLQFMGDINLTANASAILMIGGYNKAGAGQTTAGILRNTANTPTGTWTALSSPLPTALGEVEIVRLTPTASASRFLVIGGRPTRDAAATVSAWILTLDVGTATASWSRHNMGQARVLGKDNLHKCGTSSKYIAIGGVTVSGMISIASLATTNSIEVFNVNGANQALSAWSTLKDGSGNTVTLTTSRGYHRVLNAGASNSQFIVSGVMNAGTPDALASVEGLTVNASNCTATASTTTALNNLPSARARAHHLKTNVTINSIVYDFVIATGNDTNRYAVAPPTDVFFYRSANDSYNSTTADLRNGRVFGRVLPDDTTAGSVKVGTGVQPDGTTNTNSITNIFRTTPVTTDVFATPGAGRSNGTDITRGRVGSAVRLFGLSTAADYAALGTSYSGGVGATETSVFDF